MEVQRTRGLDVDHAANVDFGNVRRRGLVDLGDADDFRRQHIEIEGTRTGGRGHLAVVDRHGDKFGAKAANGNLAGFAAAAIHRHTGHTLQGIGDIRIGKFPCLFRGNRIHHIDGILLDGLCPPDRRQLAGHRDLIQRGHGFVVGFFLGIPARVALIRWRRCRGAGCRSRSRCRRGCAGLRVPLHAVTDQAGGAYCRQCLVHRNRHFGSLHGLPLECGMP